MNGYNDFKMIPYDDPKYGYNYPLVNIQKAMENGHRNSGFSHEKMVDLSIANC